MYARIASFEGGDDERMRTLQEERMKSGQMQMPEGMQGGMAMTSRDGSRRLFISFFDSAEAIDAAEAQFEKMGDEIPEDVRGRRTSVEVYDILWDSSKE